MDIKELYELYRQHPYITTDSRDCPEGSIFLALKGETFDGNQFAVQALQKGCAYAIVDVIEQEHLVENAAKVGKFLIDTLKAEQAAGNLPHVVDVRGEGLMIGIELDIPYKEPRTRLIKEEHCFTGCSGTNVIRLLPPLCLSMDEAQLFIEKFKKVL